MGITLKDFQGISPRFGDNLPPGVATIAQNVDLSSRKIRQLPEARRTVPDNLYDGLTFTWPISGLDLGISISSGVLMKEVAGVSATLGHDAPSGVNVATITVRTSLADGVTYQWTASGSGTDEYYCEIAGGGDPSLADPDAVRVDGALATEGILGSLAEGEWGYGDNDTLGWSTVYVRLTGGSDPDTAGKIIYHETDNGNVVGSVTYIITTTRNVGGHIDESGPTSPSVEIPGCLGDQILLTCPVLTESYVTHWNIYRLSSNTGEYLFVAQVAAATSTYTDNLADASLGSAVTTWYTSSQENEIIFAKPGSTSMDGIATKPYAGMIFAWDGETLYWSEPGLPDAWPDFYNMNFPSKIKRVVVLGGALAVLTEDYPFRVDGTNPELLQQSDVLGNDPCPGTAAYPTSQGVVFLTDSGIGLFNLFNVSILSDTHFTEQWFNDNISSIGAELIETDRIIYLVHSGGVLVLDNQLAERSIWYVLDEDTAETWIWQSGDILVDGQDMEWLSIAAKGFGSVAVTVYLDGVELATKTLDLDSTMDRNKRLQFPLRSIGRALQIKLTGAESGVDEVFIEVDRAA